MVKYHMPLKIKSCGFRPNNARYEEMLRSKIVHLKEIYNFDFDHFLTEITVFVLIMKYVIKNQKIKFSGQTATYGKMLRNKIVHLKKIYKFYLERFLIGIIVFLININSINQKKKHAIK